MENSPTGREVLIEIRDNPDSTHEDVQMAIKCLSCFEFVSNGPVRMALKFAHNEYYLKNGFVGDSFEALAHAGRRLADRVESVIEALS